MSNNPDNEKLPSGKLFPIDLASQKITIIKGTAPTDSKVPHLVSGSKISGAPGQLIAHGVPLSLMRPATQIISHGMSSQTQVIGGHTVAGTVLTQTGPIVSPLLQGAQIISQPTQGTTNITGQTAVRTLPANVRLVSSQHVTIPTASGQRPSMTVQSAPGAKQLTTSYHVPRGPAAVASLAMPRGTTTPRASTPSSTTSWTTGSPIRTGALVYAPRPPRPHTLQVPARPALRQGAPQVSTAAVVARAVRPPIVASPQRTPTPPQGFQGVTTTVRAPTPKVVPIVQRSYQPTKVVGVTLGVRPSHSPRPGGTFYYELSSGVAGPTVQAAPTVNLAPLAVPASTPVAAAPPPATTVASTTPLHHTPSVALVSNFAPAVTTVGMGSSSDLGRSPNSPSGVRPSILRKRDNEGSPMKLPPPAASPPPSPGGSTTVSAASSPGPEDDEPPPPQPAPTPVYNNCSPRKKPRKQLLVNEVRSGARSGDCEFPAEGGRAPAPSPPPAASPPPTTVAPDREKPPRRSMLGAGWRCGWRATALHFTRPSDVRRREERRPSVVELAAQRRVLQKANGWKLHHLTAQMDDLGELEAGVLQQAAAALQVLETKPQPDLHRLCELLKGNIQRSKIVGEGVAEARSNVLKVFQHKEHVSDILARQADKRCFKKHRNQC